MTASFQSARSPLLKLVRRTFGALVATGLLLAASGCAVESTEGYDLASTGSDESDVADEEVAVPFASFATDGGGTVQFYEPEAGELLVSSISPLDEEDPLAEQDPAALYEKLAGEPLPERFHAAVAAVNNAAEQDELEVPVSSAGVMDVDGSTDPEVATLYKESYTTESYSSKYCQTSYVNFCWVNRTNTSYFQKRVDNFGADAYSYRGSITHRLSRKNTWGNWKTLLSSTVPAGYRSHLFNTTLVAYTHESKVYDASGDGYHHSGYNY